MSYNTTNGAMKPYKLVVNLRQKKINYCLGCFTCSTKPPGMCVHKDEMALELFPKWLEADIMV